MAKCLTTRPPPPRHFGNRSPMGRFRLESLVASVESFLPSQNGTASSLHRFEDGGSQGLVAGTTLVCVFFGWLFAWPWEFLSHFLRGFARALLCSLLSWVSLGVLERRVASLLPVLQCLTSVLLQYLLVSMKLLELDVLYLN